MELNSTAFDLVIFDWAGTMVDFGCRAPVAALTEAFARRKVVLNEAAVRADMGKAKADHVRALLARPEIAVAWRAARGSSSSEADVEELMEELGPLMMGTAAKAAKLIPGAVETLAAFRGAGVKIASSTGYTREMMAPVLACAAEQGYSPDHLICANETPQGRPSPLMIYKACAELGVWPLARVIKVDDAEAGVQEGRNAGCFTVGVAASGNGMGLSQSEFAALDYGERGARLNDATAALKIAGADIVIETIADLIPALNQRFNDAQQKRAPRFV